MFAKFMSWLVRPIVAHIANDPAYLKLYATKVEDIAKHIDKGHLSEVICDTLDTDDICARVAKDISAYDVAQQLDLDDIHESVKDSIDVDARSVAGEIDISGLAREFDMSEIANEIDYKALAKALIRELGAANKVECRPSAT